MDQNAWCPDAKCILLQILWCQKLAAVCFLQTWPSNCSEQHISLLGCSTTTIQSDQGPGRSGMLVWDASNYLMAPNKFHYIWKRRTHEMKLQHHCVACLDERFWCIHPIQIHLFTLFCIDTLPTWQRCILDLHPKSCKVRGKRMFSIVLICPRKPYMVRRCSYVFDIDVPCWTGRNASVFFGLWLLPSYIKIIPSWHQSVSDFNRLVNGCGWWHAILEFQTYSQKDTLPETNIAPTNGWLEDELSFWETWFSGAMLVSGRVSPFFLGENQVSRLKHEPTNQAS